MTNKRRAPNRQVAKRAEVQVECDLGGAVGTRRHTHRSDVGRAATCSSRSRVSGRWLEPDGPPRPRPWTRRRLRAIGRGRPVARLEHLHGGGDRNRTGVQGFAGPCLNHSATPPGAAHPTWLPVARRRSGCRWGQKLPPSAFRTGGEREVAARYLSDSWQLSEVAVGQMSS